MYSASQQSNTLSGRVTAEGDELFYEVRGQGSPLLMICGGGGDSWWYYPLADRLARFHRVITYDRRANARSTGRAPLNFEISQQSRDAIAVLEAAGERSAAIFGSSTGAIIALDLAKRYPQAVRVLIVHEPPLVALHRHAAKWRRFFAGIYATSLRYGTTLATLKFALFAGLPLGAMLKAAKPWEAFKKEHAVQYVSAELSALVSMQLELLPLVNYVPDFAELKNNNVRVRVAAGAESLQKQRFYAQSCGVLAQRLGVELVPFPGNHVSFFHRADEWARAMHSLLVDCS